MLAVYADETGTGGIPASGNEPAPGVYGWLMTVGDWDVFRSRWSEMLNRHKAPYFHFRELNPNYQKQHPDNFFASWNEDQKDDFIYDMAFVASTGPIPFGGNFPEKQSQNKKELYTKVFDHFWGDFGLQMDRHFPNEHERVSFFFAKNKVADWLDILDVTHKKAKARDSKIAEYIHIDPYCERGIPCQAADLLAFIARQNTSAMYDAKKINSRRILDIVLMRKMYLDDDPFKSLAQMDDTEWYAVIQKMRGLKKNFDNARRKLGMSKKQFYPTEHDPYLRGLLNKFITFKKIQF